MDIQSKRVAYAMREKCCTYSGRKYCGFLRPGSENSEFLETAHENTVAKKLHRVPVQFRFEYFEGGLEEIGASFGGTLGSRTYCLHLEDKLVDHTGLGSEFTSVTYGHRPCN